MPANDGTCESLTGVLVRGRCAEPTSRDPPLTAADAEVRTHRRTMPEPCFVTFKIVHCMQQCPGRPDMPRTTPNVGFSANDGADEPGTRRRSGHTQSHVGQSVPGAKFCRRRRWCNDQWHQGNCIE